ncbi:MAG: mycofactocin-coupled SDR family oxidoreductase [Solirubrobacteraceae bacterium]
MGMLEGRTAFITGGARGMGRAHAVTCAREGADVILFDVPGELRGVGYDSARPSDLDETIALVEGHGRRALAATGDVRSQADLGAAVAAGIETFGKIDIVIANAGIWSRGPEFWELTEDQWDQMLAINLTGTWKTVKAVAPIMTEARSGSVVVTGSINGLEPGDHYTHYSTSKHGVVGLMKNMALELAPYGVRCNAICPGATDTPLANNQQAWDMFAGHSGGTPAEWIEGGYHYNALRGLSWLDPQTMADAALFLNSDLAYAITGIVLPVDAGHLLLTGHNHQPTHLNEHAPQAS